MSTTENRPTNSGRLAIADAQSSLLFPACENWYPDSVKVIHLAAIDSAWKEFHPSPQNIYNKVYLEFHKEQPFLAAYLKIAEERLFPESPGALSYLGVFITRLFKEYFRPIAVVSVETITRLEGEHSRWFKLLDEESEMRSNQLIAKNFRTHPQFYLMGFLTERFFEGEEDAPELVHPNTGHAVTTLLIAVDALSEAVGCSRQIPDA